MTKGELIRLIFRVKKQGAYVDNAVYGAQQLSLHISCATEQITTKDTDGDWVLPAVTSINYDISSTALVKSNEQITATGTFAGSYRYNDLLMTYEEGKLVNWQIANMSGTNHRTKGAVICSGQGIINQLTVNSQNKQAATYSTSILGKGDITIGAAPDPS